MGQCHCQCNTMYVQEIGDRSDTEESDSDHLKESSEDLCSYINERNSLGELSPRALTHFILTSYLERLPDALKTLCMQYLCEESEKYSTIDNLNLQYPFNSTVLTTKEKYSLLSVFKRHLKNRQITFKLVYRASQDGYNAETFHNKVDKYDYTVFIIEPQSNTQTTRLPVFGAFTSIKMTNIEKEHRDTNMVLFRVRSDYRSKPLTEPNIYHSEMSFQYHRQNYVKTFTHSVAGFGCKGSEGTYLFIDDQFDWRNNYVRDDGLTKWMQDTIGYSVYEKEKLYFRIKELEVFQIEQLFVN